jgi:integrase
MTSGSSSSQDRWASIRTRKRTNGDESHAVLYWIDGGQRTITYRNRLQAEALCAAIRAHGAHHAFQMNGYEIPDRAGQEKAPLTAAEWIGQHIDSLSGIEQKTRTEYKRYLTRDIEPTLGQIPLAALNRQHISNWVNSLHAGGNSGKTCGNKLGFLSGCLNAAVPKHIPANPATGIRLPRTVRRQMVTLTPGEYNILKSAFTNRWHPLLDLLVASGCRFSEATALTPADIDSESNTIHITKAWKRVPEGDGERYELGAPKSERSIRRASVPAWVIDSLDLTGEYVFTNSHGGPIRLYSWRSNVWVPSLAKARAEDPHDDAKPYLKKHPRIHDLRHTAASLWLSQGVPLITVSAQLGHEDVAITAKAYAHLVDGAGKAAADAMTKLLGTAVIGPPSAGA